MKNKLVIAIAALMVAALAAPAVIADVTYTATVVTCNVAVTELGTSFDGIIPGNCDEISPSLNLNNTGGANCNISAKFTSSSSGTYGLVSGANVIGGSNFSIGPDGSETALLDTDTETFLGTVLANSNVDYDAILCVPSDQVAGGYSGIVQLIFTAG